MPIPTDSPVVHAAGATPDRVLLIGSGPVVGYGVLAYELSISGEIARHAARLTQRGMDIDIITAPRLDVSAVVDMIPRLRLDRYDALMLILGSYEVSTLRSIASWTRDLNLLLDVIRQQGGAYLPILVAGVPPLDKVVRLPLLELFVRHCRKMDAASKSAAATRNNVTFVPLQGLHAGPISKVDRRVNAEWAASVAPALAEQLERDSPPRCEAVDEEARLVALHELRILDTGADSDIHKVVDDALQAFGAAGASFSLIDRERHIVKSGAGLLATATEVPRAESICAVTIETSRLLVIEDMSKDPHYVDKPFVTGEPGLRFYAGYPVEAPSGERIGSLCIVDVKPREFSAAEASLLRELALRVQRIVWNQG